MIIGTAQFGMSYGIANKNGQMTGEMVFEVLDMAEKNGIDTLDTAKFYGNSERVIGKYLELHPHSSWNIITKIGNNDKNVSDQLEDSFEKLNIYPSVVLSHSSALFLDTQFQKELAEAKEKQILDKVGVSLYSEDEINRVMSSKNKPDIIQLPLNILDKRLYHHDTLCQLTEEGIEIHARSAFLQGLFFLPDSELKGRFLDAVPYLKKLKFIAAKAGLNLAELSLLWLISLQEVSKVVIGLDKVDHLKIHLDTLNKSVEQEIFLEAMSVQYENEDILNPSLWS